MKRAHLSSLLLCLISLLLCSCGHNLESESGLYNVELESSYRVALDGYWVTPKESMTRQEKKGTIYIAPIDVSKVQEKEPELCKLITTDMRKLFVSELKKALKDVNAANKRSWSLTDNPKKASVRVDIAVVRLRAQLPTLRVLGNAGSLLAPVPGTGVVVDSLTDGDICIEATIKDARTNELLFAMKDSNRKKTRLYQVDAYRKSGNVRSNMKAWAEKLAYLFRNCAPDRLGDKSLADAIKERSFFSATWAHLGI